MSYYISTEPEIIRQGILPISTTNVSSISSNFYSNIVVLGYQNENLNRGCIEIHRYNIDNDTWFDKIKIDGPHENSYFGKSVDMDWDGERIMVGANTAANVYIYDWDGGQFQNYSNIIEGPGAPGSEFGFSVSIAKNRPDVISIGSPGDNMMYVYQLENDTWIQRFSNSGVDINNLIPYSNLGEAVYDSSNNVITNSIYNRYGEVVKMSSGGDYVIVGQPGTPLLSINTYNTTNFDIIDSQYHDETVYYIIEDETTYYGEDFYEPEPETGMYKSVFVHTKDPYYVKNVNYNRQLGSVRVFNSDNASWDLSNTQVGNLLYGERNCGITSPERSYLNDGEDWIFRTEYGGWGLPGFGLSCDISSDGRYIVVGAPLYSSSEPLSTHDGKVYTYELKDNIWVELNTVTHGISSFYKNNGQLVAPRYGLNVRLDYSGNRLVVNGSIYRSDLLGIYDFVEKSWVAARNIYFYKKSSNLPDSVLETSDGKTIIMSRTDNNQNTILFADVDLTQIIFGNNLMSGFISAHDVYSRGKLGIGVTPSDTSPYYLKVKSPDGVQENIVEIASTTNEAETMSVNGIHFLGNVDNSGFFRELNDPITSCKILSGHNAQQLYDISNSAYLTISIPTDISAYGVTMKDCIVCTNGGKVGIAQSNPQYQLDVNGDINFTGNLIKNGVITSWTALTLLNGWENYGFEFYNCQYRKSVDGRVYLRGLVKSGTVGSVIATLPLGFRPERTELFGIHAGGIAGRVDVRNNGEIHFIAGNNSYVQLDGLSFDAV